MIDPHADHVALQTFAAELAAAAFPDPTTAAVQAETVAALAAEPAAAELGALVHHLLAQAASDGAENDLLARAEGLWARGAALCAKLGTIRADLEQAIEQPGTPGAADRFNDAIVDVQVLANAGIAMRAEIDALRADALAFPHLPPHPRQRDDATDRWDWGNLTIGRRTDAFVRTLHDRARGAGDAASIAFAAGAVASYGGNVAGSAYLGHVVGGPRRSHRIRDRMARNALGSWLAANHPAAITPTAIADRIDAGAAGAALPAEIETLVRDALTATFDLNRTQPLPDLQLGYQRLVAQLRLLDRFSMPEPPAPPAASFLATLYSDPQNPPPSLKPQDVDVVGQDGGGVAVQYGSSDPTPGSKDPKSSDGNTICGIIVALIIVIDVIQAFVQCIGQWANNNTCTFWDNMLLKKVWEQDPPDPRDPSNPQTTSQQLTVLATAPQVTQAVAMLFDIHSQIWEAMSRAYAFLAACGLIYPTSLETTPLFAQFTAIPATRVWPMREEPDPPRTSYRYPASPLEEPGSWPSPFPLGADPAHPFAPGGELSAPRLALSLWRQMAAGERDSQNLDLDADRGDRHSCWAAAGSVQDNPIDVVILAYGDQ